MSDKKINEFLNPKQVEDFKNGNDPTLAEVLDDQRKQMDDLFDYFGELFKPKK